MAKEPNWSPEELKVVDHYVRKLGRGHEDAMSISRACLAEMERTRRLRRAGVRRTLVAVHSRLLMRAHSLGLAWTKHSWTDEEIRLVEPDVQAFLRGEYPSVRAARQACYATLPARIRRMRASYSIYQLMYKLARRHGLKQVKRPPDRHEGEILDRYVRALHEGRYRYVPTAAPDCLAELQRLHRSRPDAGMVQPGTLSWVTGKLYKRSEALGLPRFRNLLTPTERKLLERFARKVDRGELPDWLSAAKECLAEIRRRYAHPLRLRPGGPRRLTSHSLHTIHDDIRELSRKLNLRGPRCIRWSAEETKLLEGWLRWCSRYRHVKRLHPMRRASEGLQEDLAKLGSNRTVSACRNRLTHYLNRRLGRA